MSEILEKYLTLLLGIIIVIGISEFIIENVMPLSIFNYNSEKIEDIHHDINQFNEDLNFILNSKINSNISRRFTFNGTIMLFIFTNNENNSKTIIFRFYLTPVQIFYYKFNINFNCQINILSELIHYYIIQKTKNSTILTFR